MKVSKNMLISIMIITGIALAGLLITGVLHAASTQWLVSITPDNPYTLQPIVFKAYSYDPATQQTYTVSCNITIVNETDIILFTKASGNPAIKDIVLSHNGTYTMSVFCVNSLGDRYSTTYKITVRYPTPKVVVKAVWMHPVNMTIITPYPYDKLPVNITYQGKTYTATINNGEANILLPSTSKPTYALVTLLGYTTNHTIDLQPVPILPELSAKTIKLNETAKLSVQLDRLAIKWPVEITVSGPCKILENTTKYSSNTTYTIVPDKPCPFCQSTCLITVSAELWPSEKVSNTTMLTIQPVKVLKEQITATNNTPWNYTIKVHVKLDTTVYGNLTLLINGKTAKYIATNSSDFKIIYNKEFYPGLYSVTARLKILNTTGNNTIYLKTITLNIPRHPYKIHPPPKKVYAGDTALIDNAYWYNYIPSNNTVILVAYYPGDSYYAPNYTMFKVQIIYPKLVVTHQYVKAYNTAPGSHIDIYCILNGNRKLIAQIYGGGNITYKIPSALNCDTIEAVYKNNYYVQVAYPSQAKPINILTTTCIAGQPCILLPNTSYIKYARIGNTPYTPGTKIVLHSGIYTLYIYTRDGHIVTVPVTVKNPEITVITYKTHGVWVVEVNGPPHINIELVLADGSIIYVHTGIQYVYEEPVSAYWQYGEIKFIKATLIG